MDVLFPTQPHSFRLLCRFRFKTQTFLSSLIAYIFDTAIGANWKSFTARLLDLQQSLLFAPTADEDSQEVQDVFSLLNYHSAVLDKILEECLLKARHRSVAKVLNGCLEIILQLGKLVGERTSNIITELDASAKLVVLFHSFDKGILQLVRRQFISARFCATDGNA